jgi:multiple RNA-binding domain-containing protein 1
MNPNTRVCIKNLPSSFDENSVKKHLLSNSSNSNTTTELIITDCKLLRTKDGKSRKVAFVGFKTPEMATFVVNYFHQTFALTSKLSVDHAFMKKQIDKDNTNKDQNAEYRPWSKYSIGSSRYNNNNNESKKESETNTNHIDVENIGQTQEEIKRDEFISTVMGNSRKKWSNDDEEMKLTLL